MSRPPTPPPPPIPAPITNVQHEEIWKHLLENVLKYKEGDDVFNVLDKNGITDIEELMSEYADNPDDIAKWKYKREDSGTTYTISRKGVSDVTALQDYIRESTRQLGLNTPAELTKDKYMALNRYDFAIMRTSPHYKKTNRVSPTPPPAGTPAPAPVPTTTATPTPTPPGPPPQAPQAPAPAPPTPAPTLTPNPLNPNATWQKYTPAESFQKSIKRDPDQFPELSLSEL